MEIELTKGLTTTVDKCDEDLQDYKWCTSFRRKNDPATAYAMRWNGTEFRYMHKEIVERIISRPLEPGECVDHKNRNTLDNCRCNLRLSNKSLNGANRGIPKNNTSGFKGVYRKGNKWRAQIKCNGERRHLGYFDTPEDAARAYDAAAVAAFGEFAYLNFPEEWTLPVAVEELVEVALAV